jgi:Superinfection immunity protein
LKTRTDTRDSAIGIVIFAAVATVLAWFAGADFGQLSRGRFPGFLLTLAAYFLPAIVANWRGHHNANAISMLNLLLGWTVFGWIIALIWATTEFGRQWKTAKPGKRARKKPV